MKNDLIFSCIAIPFTIGFGIASCQPLWAMAIFAAMLLLRYTAAPPTAIAGRHRSAGSATGEPYQIPLESARYRPIAIDSSG